MAAKPLLGIMTQAAEKNGDNEELRFCQKLALASHKLGLDLAIFSPLYVEDKSETFPLLFYDQSSKKWRNRPSPPPDLIYDRYRHKLASNGSIDKVKRFRQSHKHMPFLNFPLPNKWRVHQVLLEHSDVRPYLPPTALLRNNKGLLNFIQKYHSVYLKPINGTGGRGVLRLTPAGEKYVRVEGRNFQRSIITPMLIRKNHLFRRLHHWFKHKYIIQKGIPTIGIQRAQDFRLLIQKNEKGEWEVTGCAARIGSRRSITSNLHGGGKAVSAQTMLTSRFSSKRADNILDQMNFLGLATANALEKHFGRLCELGLDIAVDFDGHPWLLEVNPKPSREIFRKIGDMKTYRKAIVRPLTYALWLYKQAKQK